MYVCMYVCMYVEKHMSAYTYVCMGAGMLADISKYVHIHGNTYYTYACNGPKLLRRRSSVVEEVPKPCPLLIFPAFNRRAPVRLPGS